jgi:hypothetical protein
VLEIPAQLERNAICGHIARCPSSDWEGAEVWNQKSLQEIEVRKLILLRILSIMQKLEQIGPGIFPPTSLVVVGKPRGLVEEVECLFFRTQNLSCYGHCRTGIRMLE